MSSVASGPAAAYDDSFAMIMLPHEPSWKTNVVAAAPGSDYIIARSPNSAPCNATVSGVVLQGRAWNITGKAGGGLVGRGAGLWAGRRQDLDAAIQRGQARFNLPSPKIDGVWHKRNAKDGYFLITVTPSTLNESIV